MKRTIILATAATAMLTGCVKTEVNPVAVPEQEISYQAVVGPKTKAIDPTHQTEFSTSNKFKSYGYLLGQGESWEVENDKNEAQLYIDNALISFKDNTWKCWTQNYYWPSSGSITFFAWSTNSENVELATEGGTVTCSKATEITVENYNAVKNQNTDFMVADVQKNISQNDVTPLYKVTGVPTLFKHKMCQVKYSVKTDHGYEISEFRIKGLKFNNIYQIGNYTQKADEWTFTDMTKINYQYASSVIENTADPLNQLKYPKESAWVKTFDQHYFIPQKFSDDATIEIKYEIKNSKDSKFTEFTKSLSLSDNKLFGTKGWEKNKIYTINITLGLDEILWDPAVEDWTTGDVGVAGDDPDWSIVESKNN